MHADFNLPDAGKHNFVSMPDQLAANPSTLSTEVATY
jgi:hypothetical protein